MGAWARRRQTHCQGARHYFLEPCLTPSGLEAAIGVSVTARGLIFLLMGTNSPLTFPLARILFLKLASPLLPTLLAS